MSKWEKRIAFVLCNHDNGAIFKALEECLRSKSVEMAKACLVTATWLMHMLSRPPETGVKMIASRCLLDQFVEVLYSSRNLEEKVLATLALKSFISDPGDSQSASCFQLYPFLNCTGNCCFVQDCRLT